MLSGIGQMITGKAAADVCRADRRSTDGRSGGAERPTITAAPVYQPS